MISEVVGKIAGKMQNNCEIAMLGICTLLLEGTKKKFIFFHFETFCYSHFMGVLGKFKGISGDFRGFEGILGKI